MVEHVESLLGSNQCLKCIGDGDDFVFTNCAARYLQAVSLQNKTAELLVDAATLHHEQYWCSTKTLVTLACNWVKVMQHLLAQGVPIDAVLAQCHRAISLSVDHIRHHTTSTRTLLHSTEISSSLTAGRMATSHTGTEDSQLVHSTRHDDKPHDPVCMATSLADNSQEGFVEVELNHPSSSSGAKVTRRDTDGASVTARFCTQLDDASVSSANRDSDEDIGWFFEDGKVPELPDYQKEVVEVAAKIHDVLLGSADQNTTHSLPSLGSLRKPTSWTVTSQDHGHGSVFTDGIRERTKHCQWPTLRSDTGDSDSEFGLEGENEILSSTYSSEGSHKSSGWPTKEQCKEEDEEDEFDLCFEGVKHVQCQSVQQKSSENQHIDNKYSLPHETSTSPLPNIKEADQKYPIHAPIETPLDSGNKAADDIEAKLQQILQRKKENKNSNITSRSRHFRTIQDSVNELQDQQINVTAHNFGQDDVELSVHETSRTMLNFSDVDALEECSKSNRTNRLLDDLHSLSYSKNSIDKNTQRVIQTKSGESPESKQQSVQNQSPRFNTMEPSLCESHKNVAPRICDLKIDKPATWEISDIGSSSGAQHFRDPSKDVCPKQLETLVQALSHGAGEIVPLVVNASLCQLQAQCGQHFRFGTEGIVHSVICPRVHWERSCVVRGVVVATSAEQLTVLGRTDPHKTLLLIHGDLRASYTHKGQQVKQKCAKVATGVGQRSMQQTWLQDVHNTVTELAVTALVVSGSVDQTVLDLCLSLDIVVISEAKYSVLQAIGEASGSSMAAYVTECTQENVARGVKMSPYAPDWANQTTYKPGQLMVVLQPSDCIHQTAVICHPSPQIAAHREEQFWHTARRLALCTESDCILPGGGATERQCARMLVDKADTLMSDAQCPDGGSYSADIWKAVATGFQNFVSLVNKNCPPQTCDVAREQNVSDVPRVCDEQNVSGVPRVCDDLVSKTEAWRTACHVACQILLIDQEITTGLDKTDRNVMF